MQFEAQKRLRIKRYFYSMQNDDHYWWDCKGKRWVDENSSNLLEISSNSAPVKSLRAFRRQLRKAPKGIRFRLVNCYIGFDVYATSK